MSENAYTQHVENLWPRRQQGSLDGLIEAAEAVKELERSQGWAVARKVLVDVIISLDKQIERSGGELTHPQMMQLVGRRAAFREVQDVLDAVSIVADHRLQRATAEAAIKDEQDKITLEEQARHAQEDADVNALMTAGQER